MMRLIAVLAVLPAVASGSAATGGELSWFAGCWMTPDKTSQEVWVVEGDGSLTGFNVTVTDNSVSFYEVLNIRPNQNGTWAYTAHPSGQERTSFVLAELSENSAVFTNPDHDYPQQIAYVRDGDRLDATISLLGGEKPNIFSKVACETVAG